MTVTTWHLEDLFHAYLATRMQAGSALALAEGLTHFGLLDEAHTLQNYYGIIAAAERTIAVDPLDGRTCFAGPLPPKDPHPGQVWFDVCEVCPMILVVRHPKDYSIQRAEWVSMRPVYCWQFRTFLRLVQFRTGRIEFKSPPDLMRPERFAQLRSTDFVTGLYHDEALAYAHWFGKNLCGRMTLKFLRAFLGKPYLDRVAPPGMRLWDEAEFPFSEFVRIAVGQDTLDKNMMEEFELRESGENVKLPNRILFEEWDQRGDIGLATYVYGPQGLKLSQTTQTIHMWLLNTAPRQILRSTP